MLSRKADSLLNIASEVHFEAILGLVDQDRNWPQADETGAFEELPEQNHSMKLSAPILAVALLAPSLGLAQATRFDGKWNVTLTCPPTNDADGAKGYTHMFPAEVKDGYLVGMYGKEGELGSQRLSGQISNDGSAELRLDGIVSNPDYAIGKSPTGKAFTYRVRAKFEQSSGTGQRTSGRTCDFRFSR